MNAAFMATNRVRWLCGVPAECQADGRRAVKRQCVRRQRQRMERMTERTAARWEDDVPVPGVSKRDDVGVPFGKLVNDDNGIVAFTMHPRENV